MYFPDSRKAIVQDQILQWTMQGMPGRNANLKLALQIHFVTLPNGRRGIALGNKTQIPLGIDVTGQMEFDTTTYQGKVIWLEGMNGLVLHFEGQTYQLIHIDSVHDNGGYLYFHSWLPEGFDEKDPSGNIVYSDTQHLEAFTG